MYLSITRAPNPKRVCSGKAVIFAWKVPVPSEVRRIRTRQKSSRTVLVLRNWPTLACSKAEVYFRANNELISLKLRAD